MKTIYKWKPASGIKISASVAGAHLEKLRVRNNGQLTPRAVLEDAKSRSSPLHKAFEWRDGRAAEEFRLWQARHLVNSIVVVIENDRGKEIGDKLRAFVHVVKEKSPHYQQRGIALSDADTRLQLCRRAILELVAWRRRYADLSELRVLFKTIDRLEAKYTRGAARKKAA